MIRKYKEQDLEALLDTWRTASKVAHHFLAEDFFVQERKNIITTYLPNAETWVYEEDGRVIGFLALIGNEVGGIFIHSDYQRRGIGRALLDHAASSRECLELDVFEKNLLGRNFYSAYGFSQIGEHIHEQTKQNQLRLIFKCR